MKISAIQKFTFWKMLPFGIFLSFFGVVVSIPDNPVVITNRFSEVVVVNISDADHYLLRFVGNLPTSSNETFINVYTQVPIDTGLENPYRFEVEYEDTIGMMPTTWTLPTLIYQHGYDEKNMILFPFFKITNGFTIK